ncbi:hypothetical protein M011DRAFT_461523 [Sporormia fimetaria CBS 119925]|uniref:SEC7 domain-containing protein n=1 Tax=Sporormia fimetaria CBS 119925 TaxID=1340428 RepID=A0A6A6V1J6_9PLEO|nr:hypothetical protein M011DRAFT_461523 [Sporormia fimetaria CBS 119925]
MAPKLDTRLPPQETFYNDSTPVDTHHGNRLQDTRHEEDRDSHDLSLGPDARTSVVENMLQSLDQFSSAGPSTQYSDFFLADHSLRQPGPGRQRGHTYASSFSSDYDVHPDDSSSRYSAHKSRGRRSNSSNNIQPPAVHRNGTRTYSTLRDEHLASPFGDAEQSRHGRGGPKKSSKGSTSSSMDYGHAGILGTQRWGLGRRSASFDHGHLAGNLKMATARMESILNRSRSGYQNYVDYDAAPEPTVPAGPRRPMAETQSHVFPSQQSTYSPPQQPPSLRRKNSLLSTTSRTLRKNKSQPESNMRLQAQDFVNASGFRDLPPVPALNDPPAPSPTVATRNHTVASPPAPPAAPKERPGFFRRVFGGASRNNSHSSTTSNQNPAPRSEPTRNASHQRTADAVPSHSHSRPQTTANSSHHIASQLKSMPRIPNTVSSAQKDPPPPSLAKKHSSFFRRRKKSTSEHTKVPIMSLDFRPPSKQEIPAAHPSPGVSSLRQVMNPYLSGRETPAQAYRDPKAQTPTKDDDLCEGQPHGFSPGYKPHSASRVRSIEADSQDVEGTPTPSQNGQTKVLRSPDKGSPKLRLKMRHRRPSVSDAHDGSFLADSSSNEDHSRSGTPSALRQSDNKIAGNDQGEHPSTQSAPSQAVSDIEDEDGWVLTPAVGVQPTVQLPEESGKAQRMRLQPISHEETPNGSVPRSSSVDDSHNELEKPSPISADLSVASPIDVFHSATSLPLVQIDSGASSDSVPTSDQHPFVSEEEPSEEDRQRARRLFNNEEASVQKAQVATILGDMTLTSTRIRKAYMKLFDWDGYNILEALRDLCGKLVLKAETQQVDRILMSLSERWCECNPNHGFKSTDVVHTICYSILLLNTDLHVAEIESRMTRGQFVKNTLPTVVRVCQESSDDAGEDTLRPQHVVPRRGSLPWNRSEPSSPSAEATTFPTGVHEDPPESRRARSRLSLKPPGRAGSEGLLFDYAAYADTNMLVTSPFNGPMKGWELQIESVLKEFYDSIRKQRLPLHGAPSVPVHDQPSSNNLSVAGMLRRTPSVLSKAGSENLGYRGRSQDYRTTGNRWVSKTRSRPRLYPASTVASSRTSLDDGSVFSPAGSSTWSRYSVGKTGTTMSVDSLGSHFAHGDYQQAIGFANALSQAIIREEGTMAPSDEEFTRVAPLLEDETLELSGAPWAKEGILKHKHHLEALDKKAKDRTWNECFAVIEKGYIRLFSFSTNSKSMRHKNRSRPSAGSVVGGGNWMDNAEALDSFLLRQSIASALPPPGYSKNRPHVWALSLPNGAVHLFQAGTADIVREFVSTANYWSARLSKEPLVGGVSNIEYGWGENVINPALLGNSGVTPPARGHVPRPSMASSMRSSLDHATGTMRPRLAGDKVVLSDWTPPVQSMMASNLMEVDQLRALSDYVKNVEDELARHNELRAPMLIAFSPRHPNAAKAMANWERKSSYLLREIVKFRTYIDSLTAAQNLKTKIYAQREADSFTAGAPASAPVTSAEGALENDGGNEAQASKPPPTTA